MVPFFMLFGMKRRGYNKEKEFLFDMQTWRIRVVVVSTEPYAPTGMLPWLSRTKSDEVNAGSRRQ